MPTTPSTKGSIIDQIGSIGSHFSRLFLTTPDPASLETHGAAPHAIASTTHNGGHHHLNPLPYVYYRQTDGTAPHAIASTTRNNGHHHIDPSPSAYPRQTDGTAPHAIATTTRNSDHHHVNPSPSTYSRQTAKTKTKSRNKDEHSVNSSSVHATRGNRTKKGVRKEY
jgi:hypothetical protein